MRRNDVFLWRSKNSWARRLVSILCHDYPKSLITLSSHSTYSLLRDDFKYNIQSPLLQVTSPQESGYISIVQGRSRFSPSRLIIRIEAMSAPDSRLVEITSVVSPFFDHCFKVNYPVCLPKTRQTKPKTERKRETAKNREILWRIEQC